ncbi:hypothetical protein LOD99_3662 [Oopsacas minuta]|uniref:Uncharacterized protein n=1 Tax=Oopsacas minuta TaxID=111878 RepID=A0AAV7JWV8_9METZ|nr:hypothetical protein LOD99_3662 [Oopsacas minuta]
MVENVGMHVDTPGRWQRPDDTFVGDNSIIFQTFDTTHQGLYKFYIMNWDNEETLAMQIILTVYPFGEKIDSNTYIALEDNSLLLANRMIYCITEEQASAPVNWFYYPSNQPRMAKSPTTDPNPGISILSVQTNEPGYYECQVTFMAITRSYLFSLQNPSLVTVIEDTNSFTYTKGIDRTDTSLLCNKPDNSVLRSSYYWYSFNTQVGTRDLFDVGGLSATVDGKQTLECFNNDALYTILVVDILFQGPPEITLDTGTVESYSSLTPGDNTASINLLTKNVILATVLAGRWQKPNGTFVEDNSITFSAFEISDQGIYKFYVINWESIETLAIQIQLTVYPFGEEIALREYNNLEDLSVLTTNTTLYCITDVIDIPEVIWKYEDLEGVNTSQSAETDFFTGFSSLLVTTDKVGYYSCYVTENGVSKTYSIAVMDTEVYKVVEAAQSLTYTATIDRDIAFLFCHKPDNSVPFGEIGWRELDTSERKQNPLNIADIPDDGNTHTMECLDALDDTPIFNVQILIQGPPVITLNAGSVVSYPLLPEDPNKAYLDLLSQNVALSVNLVGRWRLPDYSWFTGSSMTFSTFQLSDQGLYKFYVTDLDNVDRLAIQIDLTVNQFGEKIDSTTYGPLSTNSILTANTDLYCLNGVVAWSYRDLAGICAGRTDAIDADGASVLSVDINYPGYYSCEVTQQPDSISNTYTVAVLDTTLIQVIETSESYQYTLGVDNDIFLFCHTPDNSISSSELVWMKNDSFTIFKNPLDVFEVGNLLKYTDTYLMVCLDQTSSENILSAEISMQGPPVISVDTGTVQTFESLTIDGNTAFIIVQTQNVVMTVNLVGKWQRPDDTHISDNSITFLSFDDSDVGVYKFYVTDWYNEQRLAIQIQLSLSPTYSQAITNLKAVTSSDTSILVTWGLLAEQTPLSDEKFSIYYGYEDVEYFAGTTEKLFFNIKGLTLNFNYTIRVDLQFAYSTETYSASASHYLTLPEITDPTTFFQSASFDFSAQESVLIVVIVFLLLVIAAIFVVAIIATFCIRRHLQKSNV